jgi:hypothetical protein
MIAFGRHVLPALPESPTTCPARRSPASFRRTALFDTAAPEHEKAVTRTEAGRGAGCLGRREVVDR